MTALRKEHRLAGQGAIFLCAVLWSTSGLFIKLVDWHPILIAGGRSFIAALFMGGIRLLSGRRIRAIRKAGTDAGGIHAGGVRAGGVRAGGGLSGKRAFSVWAGGIAYAVTMLSFVIANKLTASANAILLQYSAPVWAAVLGWLLVKEKPRWDHWGALVLVMLGMLLFFKDGLAGGALLGDALAVFSGICFGANSVFMRMGKEGNPADAMLLSHIITAVFSIPFFFAYPPALTPGSAGAILFMGIFQIGCASLLFSYGIRRVRAVQAMLTAMIEPVLNPVWVLLITRERPAAEALAGGGVIVAAVIISSLIGKHREIREAAAGSPRGISP
ncbi:MAG: DMT family transporter [Treponema sp.]|jgi:drug/metabolite transporter (DMT)-like permease|nr:DMT family transporter [Treponema sp.]